MHEDAGSVHVAPWPEASYYANIALKVPPELLDHAGRALAALRKIKSEAKVSMKTPILAATLKAVPEGIEHIKAALDDIAQAGRVTGTINLAQLSAGEADDSATVENESGVSEETVLVADSELGEPPAKKPKK
jgi:valyl-tRNA synthetase